MADEKAKEGNAESTKKTTKKMNLVRGKKKGGTRFPRISLERALKYSTKLVSKTAVASQSEAILLAGVFGNTGSRGKVRASAMKQYGLMEGTAAAYKATQLAKDIDAAADEGERLPLIRRAMLAPKIFRDLFETYHGDEASKGKIRGRTQQLEVHPDSGEECAELFISSAETAKLGTRVGDGIKLIAAIDAAPLTEETSEATDTEGTQLSVSPETENNNGEENSQLREQDRHTNETPRPRTAADVTVNLTVDSSLDGDKLGKQLELLRQYGLI